MSSGARRAALMLSAILALFLPACPSGVVRYVDSEALADYTVRVVDSEAVADCRVRLVRLAPGPGEWLTTNEAADFTVYQTDGIAQITVYFSR
jgi:hypothetical protein